MPQYYDIDDIIAEDKLVPAVFQVVANVVGLFDSSDEMNKVSSIYEISNGSSKVGLLKAKERVASPKLDGCVLLFQLEQGSKVELPFWLARELHLRQAASISLPPCFNQK